MSEPASRAPRRVRARVEGTVQGVGFRPFVFRLATELGLAGWVVNDEHGVLLEAEGPDAAVDAFLARLAGEAPPLASVERVRSEELPPDRGGPDGGRPEAPAFEIRVSAGGGEPDALVSPDAATCADCLAEMLDSGDRRHRYPFINCTNCGPRFTIVRGVPYDRPLTTMAEFEMCELCRAEYDDPADRRFHAQPNACPECGPRVWLRVADEGVATPDRGDVASSSRMPRVTRQDPDPIQAAAAELHDGRILAIKGIGGFHLACLASDEEAVATLRARKHRYDKPLALMAPDLAAARELVELGEREAGLLQGRERPIVIARRCAGSAVASSVAPGAPDLGVMLPYSPLHHLLLADVGEALVMTSGNVSDEPIAFLDDDALARLEPIADLVLLHDRPIETRTDDSVLRATSQTEPLLIRRSRGYVPGALTLPIEGPATLACGAELKNTFCLAKGNRAWVGPHIGDLENYETLVSFRDGVRHFERLFAVEPQVVAHDMHPEYLSTKFALGLEGVEHVAVQHHHAHLAAGLAEQGETGPAIGAIFDGTGFGPDGTIWGGEILVGGLAGFERVGMLHPARLPGGSAAIREPWRMACSWLAVADGAECPEMPAALAGAVDQSRWTEVCELLRTGVASPLTTSMGRLFDAVAAICGIRATVNYEGQAAAELEAAADLAERRSWPIGQIDAADSGDGVQLLDTRELVRAVRDGAAAGSPVPELSARFHNSIATATSTAVRREAEHRSLDTVVLSGGVFQNRLLLERTIEALTPTRLRVLVPRLLPPNDGGISFGQAAIAAESSTSESAA